MVTKRATKCDVEYMDRIAVCAYAAAKKAGCRGGVAKCLRKHQTPAMIRRCKAVAKRSMRAACKPYRIGKHPTRRRGRR